MDIDNDHINLFISTALPSQQGAVEYTDCTTAEEYCHPMGVLDMTQNNLLVRLW